MERKDIARLGGLATKRITIENIETKATISFNSARECDEYVRNILGFNQREMNALRKGEVNGYRRVNKFFPKSPDAI